jgi:hypothetical protein
MSLPRVTLGLQIAFQEETQMAREATKAALEYDDFRVLLEGRSLGAGESPAEYLCVDRGDDGRWQVQRRTYPVLAELGEFGLDVADDEALGLALPTTINGHVIGQVEGPYVLGDELVECDWEPAFPLAPDNSFELHAWLDRHSWTQQRGFAAAWREICRLAGWVVDFRPQRASGWV